ncbi:phosphatidic acid phosphatase type 2/haloperoxidase [Podospora didyma]|uniref:Phosphatidic acid phosphatase type 2/haloperoxidase n=1 Tax=Podospora didyma TaxID=330526 RepID=A0AAE0NU63_9PEZI|nr:phosphatidic acid phosphatase type 2/haloperoxidase [Podospora didyma]
MTAPAHGSSCGSELSDGAQQPAAGKDAANGVIDAGLKSQDHYRRALPKWRYALRQQLLPLVRWETPYLAALQTKMRTPVLDSYFAITANLGTHTFFMVGLPILFWCGFYGFAKGIVDILALGVFFTGFVKDMFSLPRPLSPPLQRITMSGHVSLEYGFPSTHSTNAVSVALYAILILRSGGNTFSPSVSLALEGLSLLYAISIVFGRLYCGMHGFTDVIVGSLMGAAITLVEFYYGPAFENWVRNTGYVAPITIALVIIVLVRVHPEPADDCPCFDDSVSFAGVMIGLEYGTWRFAKTQWDSIYNGPDATFDLAAMGWPLATARVVFGVLIIFAWREVAKPTLLRFLPHLFRVIETQGLSLPRRFFVPASEYKDVPLRLRDDNVLPNVSDFPKLVRSIRGPGRGRSVSIGPQSAADAYETLAYRERRRRESLDSEGGAGLPSKRSLVGLRENAKAQANGEAIAADDRGGGRTSGLQSGSLAEYEHMMGTGTVGAVNNAIKPSSAATSVAGDEIGEKEMFQMLVKPRVRYDVEVVTKLVVYAGIGLLAVDLIIVAFELVGLGASHLGVQ